jgi:hypothetical protein
VDLVLVEPEVEVEEVLAETASLRGLAAAEPSWLQLRLRGQARNRPRLLQEFDHRHSPRPDRTLRLVPLLGPEDRLAPLLLRPLSGVAG